MKLYPFYTALSNLYEFYGIELDEDLFESYGMSAYRKIGNKVTKMKILKAEPQLDPSGGWFVCVPKDSEGIEAITLPFEDAQLTSTVENRSGWWRGPVEQAIEFTKRDPDELYIPGKYVKFTEIGDKIYFVRHYPVVNILYKGSTNDEEGLPFITDKEAEAIATYCAYLYHYKNGLSKKDQSSILIALILKKDWLLQCSLARIPETISQNTMNLILDRLASLDRHMYGRTTKPIY